MKNETTFTLGTPEYQANAEHLGDSVILIKYGGNAMIDEDSKRNFIQDICHLQQLGIIPVIVHGGGPYIAKMLDEVGIEAEFVAGHRRTDADAIQYVEMALSARVNKEIVKLIDYYGGKAVGISGKDGNLVKAQKRMHKSAEGNDNRWLDLGNVGDVGVVDTNLVDILREKGYIPVISTISVGEDLQDYNINADMFAGHLAGSLAAEYYVVLTDVDGLCEDKDDPDTLIERLTSKQAFEQIGKTIRGGMIPKIESCLIALDKGAHRANIINGTRPHTLLQLLLSDRTTGTEIIKGKDDPLIMETTQQLEKDHHLQLYKRFPITLVSGQGARVTDSQGKEYIDALAGIAVNSLGHCHPKVVKAIREQSEKLIHVSNLYYNKPQSDLARLLTQVSGMDRVMFCNSGGEAVESAIKLTRRYACKNDREGKILSLEGCFHGRTLATIATGKKKYQDGFEPMPDGFEQVPFNDFDAIKDKIENDKIIGVIIEPIQGEGGIRPVDGEYLKQVANLCKSRDITLIFDEIQCGMARSGKMFVYQHYGIKPDILTSAKALGGGFPIGAMFASDELAAGFDFGVHGTTFGGNPLACAAAFAAVNVMLAEDYPGQAIEKGSYFMERLAVLGKDAEQIKEIRGMGLMIGVELSFKCADVVTRMMQKGVLANCTMDTTVRFVPPVIIDKTDLDRVAETFTESVKEVVAANG